MYYGNANSAIVHCSGCEFAAAMHPDNLECFEELWMALAEEYSECSWCIGGGREKEIARATNVVVLRNYKAASRACVCCGEDRGLQDAHVIPRRYGGKATMPLCPTCHWNYDHSLLSSAEAGAIKSHLESQYSAKKRGVL